MITALVALDSGSGLPIERDHLERVHGVVDMSSASSSSVVGQTWGSCDDMKLAYRRPYTMSGNVSF
jgi:hypothetical protein